MTLADEPYITASCVISRQVVYKNGLPVFNSSVKTIPEFLVSVYEYLQLKYSRFHKMDNLSKLGWLAAEILLRNSLEHNKYKAEDIGVVLANSSSSLDTDIRYFETAKTIASPALFVYTLPNIMIGEICIRHRFKGENAFFIFEHFPAGFIQQYVNNLFINNNLQACVCGWVELLDNQYKAVLLLVERNTTIQADRFTVEKFNKIDQSDNGYINF